jgi:hypothetical protein
MQKAAIRKNRFPGLEFDGLIVHILYPGGCVAEILQQWRCPLSGF